LSSICDLQQKRKLVKIFLEKSIIIKKADMPMPYS